MKTIALFTAMIVVVVGLSYLYFSLAVEEKEGFEQKLLYGVAAGGAGRGSILAVEGAAAKVTERAGAHALEKAGSQSIGHVGVKAAGKVGYHAIEKMSVKTAGQTGSRLFGRVGVHALESVGERGLFSKSFLFSIWRYLVILLDTVLVVIPRRIMAYIRHTWRYLLFIIGAGFIIHPMKKTRWKHRFPEDHEPLGYIIASIFLISILFTIVFSHGGFQIQFWKYALVATFLAVGFHKLGHLLAAKFFGTSLHFRLSKSSTFVVTAVSLLLHDFFAAVGTVTVKDKIPKKHEIAILLAGTYGNLLLFSLCCFLIPLDNWFTPIAYFTAIISMAYAIDNLFPMHPMEGHRIYQYSKRIWLLCTIPLWLIFFGYFSPH
ncbi:MAG: hypothetical protein ABH950_01095 [Candidatus Altiarchaeota archaeon]